MATTKQVTVPASRGKPFDKAVRRNGTGTSAVFQHYAEAAKRWTTINTVLESHKSATVTGLLTFDRGGQAPFAVGPSGRSAVVRNLNAELFNSKTFAEMLKEIDKRIKVKVRPWALLDETDLVPHARIVSPYVTGGVSGRTLLLTVLGQALAIPVTGLAGATGAGVRARSTSVSGVVLIENAPATTGAYAWVTGATLRVPEAPEVSSERPTIPGVGPVSYVDVTIGDISFRINDGVTGATGPGVSISSAKSGRSTAITFSGENTETINVLDGKKGATGATGATGPRGPTGRSGRDGSDGSDGRDGRDGSTGPRGPRGFQGVTGPRGPRGATGPRASGNTGGGFTAHGSPSISNHQHSI